MSELTAYPPSATVSKSKPVRLLAGVAGATVVLASGLPPLTPDAFDWIGPAVGLLGLVITAFLAKSTEDNVTPTEDVAVKRISTPEGRQYVAAPALLGVMDGTVLNKPTPVAGAEPSGFLPPQLGDRPLDPFEEDLNNG